MPFKLKNAGGTYYRAATTLFHDMMHRDVEVYVDDMIINSRGRADRRFACLCLKCTLKSEKNA